MSSVLLLLLVFSGKLLAQSQPGDVVGKLVVGYQGWFATPDDRSPRSTWVHWGSPPSPGNVTIELYPDMQEYPKQYASNLGAYNNGLPSKLFSSWDDSTVDLHFKWIQQYGIDAAALQVCNKVYLNPGYKLKIIRSIIDFLKIVEKNGVCVILAFRFVCQAE